MKKVLFDESMPRPLAKLLPDEIKTMTVQQMGWNEARNGDLLELAARESFDAILTADQSMENQQNVSKLPLPVIVLKARRNNVAHYEPLVPQIVSLISAGLENRFYRIRQTNMEGESGDSMARPSFQ